MGLRTSDSSKVENLLYEKNIEMQRKHPRNLRIAAGSLLARSEVTDRRGRGPGRGGGTQAVTVAAGQCCHWPGRCWPRRAAYFLIMDPGEGREAGPGP